ncbi:MAG: TatD family hydrolase [Clostridia bacterium]|nr:TatD family hydrolase [Clostridia bacterium]
MKLFDTHCHINDAAFDADRSEVIARMHECGVENAVVIGDASLDGSDVISLINAHAFLYGAYGLHPHDAEKRTDATIKRIASVLGGEKMIALGEIGLDYHYDFSPRDKQKEVFREQLQLAYELGMPAVLHIREAHGDAYEIMNEFKARGCLPRGIMHCYGGSLESANEYIRMGYYISFSGSLTFKNTPVLTRVAQNIPLDRILIETDCPYMSPVPLRGKRNEPANVKYVCEKLADIRGMDAEEVSRITFENATNAFGL